MNSRSTVFLGGFLMVILVAVCVVVVLKIDLAPEVRPGKAVERTRNFGEGLKLARHGLYGVDLVSIGKAHMRKLRKGPFSIGAINELVLEEVSIVLPEDLWRSAPGMSRPLSSLRPSRTGPLATLSRLGFNAGDLRMSGKIPRFSALEISRLRVARLVESNAVPWFAAARGEARRSGLALTDGWSVENGRTNFWNEALLIVEPQLKLVPRG